MWWTMSRYFDNHPAPVTPKTSQIADYGCSCKSPEAHGTQCCSSCWSWWTWSITSRCPHSDLISVTLLSMAVHGLRGAWHTMLFWMAK